MRSLNGYKHAIINDCGHYKESFGAIVYFRFDDSFSLTVKKVHFSRIRLFKSPKQRCQLFSKTTFRNMYSIRNFHVSSDLMKKLSSSTKFSILRRVHSVKKNCHFLTIFFSNFVRIKTRQILQHIIMFATGKCVRKPTRRFKSNQK